MTAREIVRTRPDGLVASIAAVAVLVLGIAAALLPTTPLYLGLAGMGVLVAALLPTRVLIPVTYVAMSAVYVEAAVAGVYVGEIPLSSRIARDALLVTLAVVLGARSRIQHPLRRHLVVLIAIVMISVLTRIPLEPSTLGMLRYFVLVPFVGMVAASALRHSVGRERAVCTVARSLVYVTSVSAVVGLLQVAGIFAPGFYEPYVEGGRSVGIVGQPNNQAFLLVIGVVGLRHTGAFRPKTALWLALLLSAGVFATYSRSGMIALVLVWLVPAMNRRLGKRRIGRSLAAAALMLLLAPTFFAARGEIDRILRDQRLELIDRAISDLGATGVLVGDPTLRTGEKSYVTDNAWVDAVIVGGLPLALGWGWLFWRQWRRGAERERALLLAFLVASIAAGAFGLFPGVLFMWTLLFLGSPRRDLHLAPAELDQRLPHLVGKGSA